jgi:hypothetical protein
MQWIRFIMASNVIVREEGVKTRSAITGERCRPGNGISIVSMIFSFTCIAKFRAPKTKVIDKKD